MNKSDIITLDHTIRLDEIIKLVRKVIHEQTGVPRLNILLEHDLLSDYGYDDMGKMALAPTLNAEFTRAGSPITGPLHATETQDCEKVIDLVQLICARFGV